MGLRKRNKLIQGVGVNDADYNVSRSENVDGKYKTVWRCPYYITWKHMLIRCYNEKYHLLKRSYEDCEVCDEWKLFSNFKKWMETQDWKGKQLDKDLLKEGNKVYCPEYCIFVDGKVNNFVLDCNSARGNYMIGVDLHKQSGKFRARCSNTLTGESEHLGEFYNELEAHLAWKKRKHELACILADSELVSDPRLEEALRTRYL